MSRHIIAVHTLGSRFSQVATQIRLQKRLLREMTKCSHLILSEIKFAEDVSGSEVTRRK